MGLVISRQFVRLMHGDMTVSSRKGKGSVFAFNIRVSEGNPVESATGESLRRVIALEPNQPKYKILITDDKPDNRRLLSELLLPFGFDIREAENGQQAVEIWESWEPHLIWMDMRMPVMDGYEATRRIKNSSKGQSTVVIALTASAFEEERQKILFAGCDDFVRKPFRESELFDMMEKHIKVRFIYEEPETVVNIADEQPKLSAKTLASVPLNLLSELEDATIRADMNRMEEIIDEIGKFDKNMADTLRNKADGFEYDKILAMICKS